jgi:predicted histidine transporter YuiF (NhaC family)
MESISRLIEKLSAYQLLNYVLSGVIFNCIVDETMSFTIAPDDILNRLIVYYITGMILSRIGSTFIEPVFKKLCVVVYAKYKNYLKASSSDKKLEVLVMENNTYRTLLTTFICLLIIYAIDQIQWLHDKYQHPIAILIYFILLIVVFSLSFRKQTEFIRKRVHRHLEIDDEEAVKELKAEQKKIKIRNSIL